MRIGDIFKLARGGVSADEMGELLTAMGIDLKMVPIPPGEYGPAFQHTAQASQGAGVKLMALAGKMKSGERMEALILLIPPAPFVTPVCIDRHTRDGLSVQE